MLTTDKELRQQFTARVLMAYREHAKTFHRSPAAACNAIYWVSRLYPKFGTQDVTNTLTAYIGPETAETYWRYRFNDITSRA